MNVASRGVRNAFRNPIRAFSIVVILGLSIGLALTMLVAYKAVGNRINEVKSSVGNTIAISPAGVRGFEGGGNALTQQQLDQVARLSHITSVDGRLNDRLDTSNTNLQTAIEAGQLGQRFAGNNGQGFVFRSEGGTNASPEGGSAAPVTRTFTPPIIVVGTTQPTEQSDAQGNGTFKLTSGQVFDGKSTEDVAIVGSSLATKNNLQVGSTFKAYNTDIKVVGIYDAGNTFSNNQIIMPLASLQKLSGQTGSITSATAHVDSVTNIDTATSAISTALGSAADVTNGAEEAKQAVQPLENIQKISLYSLIGAVGAGAVIILLTMIMIVRERRREIGVIKAIGASNIKVMLQFMVEAVTLTLMAAVIGVVIGAAASSPVTKLLVDNASNSNSSLASGSGTNAGPRLSVGNGNGPTTQVFRGGGRGTVRGIQNSFANIHAAAGWNIIFYGLGVALAIALFGSALASLFIAKVRPAEVMRSE